MALKKTLYEHALYELERADLLHNPDPQARKTATDTLALVKRFEKQKHTQTTGKWTLEFFNAIVNMIPLTPLTDDPEEWEKFDITKKNSETNEEEVTHRWQSRRSPSIISEDKGKTFVDMATGQTGTSLDHVEEAKKREQDRIDNAKKLAEKEASDKAAAEAPRIDPNEAKVEDAPAADAQAAEDQKAKDTFDPATDKEKDPTTGKSQGKKEA